MDIRRTTARITSIKSHYVIQPNLMSYSYRIHIKLPKDKGFKCDESTFEIKSADNFKPIKVKSSKDHKSLSQTSELVFRSDGYPDKAEAESEGKKVLTNLVRAFIRLKKGIDFGARGSTFQITPVGLEHFQKEFGVERMLEGGLGLKVYETLPPPRFAQMKVSPKVLTPIEKLEQIFNKAELEYRELSQKELLSAQLFNSSFFEEIPESRFLLLVMAIEVLITCEKRSDEIGEHVNQMVILTKSNSQINSSDKESIISSLSWLKSQSIGQAGRELAKNKLRGKKYHNMTARKFFSHIYSVRSNLVHGNSNLPSTNELGILSLALEKFVSDLLTGELNE